MEATTVRSANRCSERRVPFWRRADHQTRSAVSQGPRQGIPHVGKAECAALYIATPPNAQGGSEGRRRTENRFARIYVPYRCGGEGGDPRAAGSDVWLLAQ